MEHSSPAEQHPAEQDSPGAAAPIVSIDWGTTQLRASLLSDRGEVLQVRSSAEGIGAAAARSVGSEELATRLCQWLEPWLRSYPNARLIASGMVGSTEGLLSTTYLPCPITEHEVARKLVSYLLPSGHELLLVPGLSDNPQPESRPPALMRGEETQVIGALAWLPAGSGTIVLPGTHSKWVQVEENRILSIRSFVTGELYAWLRDHSVLARNRHAPRAPEETTERAFAEGLGQAQRLSQQGISLLEALFQVRVRIAHENLSREEALAFGSGLLIGSEVSQALEAPQGPHAKSTDSIQLVGAPEVTACYQQALRAHSVAAVQAPAGASERGHARLLALRG